MTALSPSLLLAAPAMASGRKPRVAAGAALVLALHVALLWLATRPVPAPVTVDHRVWIRLLPLVPATSGLKLLPAQTAPSPDRAPPPVRQSARAASALPPAGTPAASPAGPPANTSSTTPAGPPANTSSTTPAGTPTSTSAASPAVPAAPAPHVDPLALPPDQPAPPPDMLQLALKAAGAIDRELRAGERQLITAPLDTPSARLARGFAEARAAVKPKWFESAQIELFSAPNDPKRIYRIVTAFGEYCLFYPDKASISANGSAGSGHASFGQPRMSTCPTRF